MSDVEKKSCPYQNQMVRALVSFFECVGAHYAHRGLATCEVHTGENVHAYYRLRKDPTFVAHVIGFPIISSPCEMNIALRVLDYGKMKVAHDNGVLPGHEAATVRKDGFPANTRRANIAWDCEALEQLLAGMAKELKL